ncbi:MAG: hypothetical protein EP343_34200 [Deltaproteobacteria bacterium]|nr:MAG: hypothetical protein EP343_34200 [Deltaproteobacteria bacterium]
MMSLLDKPILSSRSRLVFGVLWLALVLMGCESPEATNTNTETPGTTPPTSSNSGAQAQNWTSNHWTKVKPSTPPTSSYVDPQYGREARRISVLHLQRMIPKLFDGLTWTDSRKNNMFSKLGVTLGQADYIYATQSHRKPTMLFMKFMDDMAGQLCGKAVEADNKNENFAKRMLIRYPRDPDKNLRFLRLKFHTIAVPEDSNEGIQNLRKLYDNVLRATQSIDKAWSAVCVSMMTSPEFFAY